ncbi:protein doublesex-like [Neltuma alba]|uniref:protein doublesex-like n=1 Tax=Neltuma alba TaxID=207710 RepID=UPI0010A2C09B|nr:protein doublesex-like [Prosopis alba]
MKSKNICFCIRIGNQKSKENMPGNAEKLSKQKTSDHHHKSRKKGKSRGYASATPVDDADGGVPGATSTGGTANAGVTAAVVTAVHMSAMSANEGGSSHGHGGDSGGGDGGG